ncbi:hypothetical protein Scep_007410 [Stephania cephalantha]|uniref:Glycosyltransferases n=1 Tax=Stephania cephalantha TaxID=152367 RepID=A0AAP0KBL5_9MAGN
MASIRRTLSPVARAGVRSIQNGDTHLAPSPLSKTSHGQSQIKSGWLLTTLFGKMDSHPALYRIQTVLLSVLSQRTSRLPERSKYKGPHWRRAFFHFFLCFMVGIFFGLTPFISTGFSLSLVSKHPSFSFEVISPARKSVQDDGVSSNVLHVMKTESEKNTGAKKKELIDDLSVETPITQPPSQDELPIYQKPLIVVTPTYVRPFQAYYLNRLAQTLKLVPPPLLWIIVEMSSQSVEMAGILRRSGVMYRHLVCDKNLTDIKDRGVHQINVALSHIELHHLDGIVYFADDDNVYSLDLFEQMREIRRFGTWPVATLIASKNRAILEGPVCNGNQVNGWHTVFNPRGVRRFYAAMTGFSFNSTILWDPKRWHRPTLEPIRLFDIVKEGLKETTFIEQVVEDESQMEGLLNCSRVMVWNLNLEASVRFYPPSWLIKKNLDVVVPLKEDLVT